VSNLIHNIDKLENAQKGRNVMVDMLGRELLRELERVNLQLSRTSNQETKRNREIGANRLRHTPNWMMERECVRENGSMCMVVGWQ